MIPLIEEILLSIGEQSANPYIRFIAVMFSVWMSSLGYQKVVEKAKIISAVAEKGDADKAKFEERESIWECMDDEYYSLKSELWIGITEFKRDKIAKGITHITIDET